MLFEYRSPLPGTVKKEAFGCWRVTGPKAPFTHMGGILSLSDEIVKPLKGLFLTYFGQFFDNSAIGLSFVTKKRPFESPYMVEIDVLSRKMPRRGGARCSD